MDTALTYEQILERLAPCGLDCERCVRYEKGRVRRQATELAQSLAGFENLASRMAEHAPVLQSYEGFREVLDYLTQGGCIGCRAGGGLLPFCAARTCHAEKAVDYCFQCDEYPCERNSYPEPLHRGWRERNERMRTLGVERFYEESLESPRY